MDLLGLSSASALLSVGLGECHISEHTQSMMAQQVFNLFAADECATVRVYPELSITGIKRETNEKHLSLFI